MTDTETASAFPFEEAIARRAAACGVTIGADWVAALAMHARRVLRANDRLHLTTIVSPEEFVERHIGEAFEGAALLPADVAGTLVDIGSGNGYPALPLVAARPGLRPTLVEASMKKAAFLANLLADVAPGRSQMVERHVQRGSDLGEIGPIRVITARAVGGWSRLLPKLAPALSIDGVVLLWAGQDVAVVRRREAWKRLRLLETRMLPGLDRSAVWMFARAI